MAHAHHGQKPQSGDGHAAHKEHAMHRGPEAHAHATHAAPIGVARERHGSEENAGHDKHAGHSVATIRDKFWISLAPTIPTLVWGHMLQRAFGYMRRISPVRSGPRRSLAQPCSSTGVNDAPRCSPPRMSVSASVQERRSQSKPETWYSCEAIRATYLASSGCRGPATARCCRISGGRPATTSLRFPLPRVRLRPAGSSCLQPWAPW
jgi:hypothetical protein